MADVIITAILSIVSSLCNCSSNNRCCYLLDLQENKEDLNIALEALRATREGVKRRVNEAEMNPNEPMKRTLEVVDWLQRVQTMDEEVVKVIKKADQEIQGRCFGGNCPINCWSARKIGKLVDRKLPLVKGLKTEGNFVDVASKLPLPSVQEEPVDLTVGMESMFEEVWSSLAKDKVRIMALYGYGGVGKTTLLKKINNAFLKSTRSSSSSNTHGFDVVILVVVSKVINIDAIQKEIGKRLGLSSPDRTSIFNNLTKKNFVLLLDDIWKKVDLQSIGIPPSHENTKSKVVFTTRSETVCGAMDADKKIRVKCLTPEDAWTLFEKKVGGNETLNSHQDIPKLAKDVARECDGLPLALVTIGRAMSTKKSVEEWKHALTTLQKYASEFPGMRDEVLPQLKRSYDNLGDAMIQSCFLYCALFPKDHSIDKAKLIDYWIGEGVILLNDFGHIDDARNKGYDVIGILKGACLLESDQETEVSEVKMRGTVRDLALWIAHECGSKRDKTCIIKTSDLTANERSWYNAERIYLIHPPHNGETPPPLKSPSLLTSGNYLIHPPHNDEKPPPLESPNLLTLLIYSCGQGTLPQNFFQFMSFLRVLDLSWVEIYTFPMSITELSELRYLSLHKTPIEVLPKELGNLEKLNYLDLSYMHHLEKIPIGVIGSLLKLRVLNLFCCSGAEYLDIEEVYKLIHLNDFGITIKIENNTLTKLLSSSNQNLHKCTKHLVLSNQYFFSGSKDKPQSTIITLEKLQLLFKLETIRLEHFREPELMMTMGIEQQQSLGSRFQNLSQVYLWCCRAVKDLTWIGYVGNLKTLDVNGCDELEEIVIVVDDDFGGSTGEGDEIATRMMNTVKDEVFKSLRTLIMSGLPNLKSICRNALAFPCLESMVVYRCPQLKKLPFDSRSNVNNTLRKITGGPKWWSELQWEEEDHNNNNNNNNNNKNNELLKSKFLRYFIEEDDHDDKNLDIAEEDDHDDKNLDIVEDESLDIVEEDESLYIVEENERLDIVQIMMFCVCVCFVYVLCLLF